MVCVYQLVQRRLVGWWLVIDGDGAPLAIMDRPSGIYEDEAPAADEGLLRQFLRADFLLFRLSAP